MKPRERLLAIVVGAIVVLFLLNLGYQKIADAFDKGHKKIDGLQAEIERKRQTIAKGQRAARQIAEFQKQSLPSDPAVAARVYWNWLLDLVNYSGLDDNAMVIPVTTLAKNPAYEKHGFTIKAECDLSLRQAINFLYGFYSTNQLHRITRIQLKPKTDAAQMDVVFDIEAIAVPGADRADSLNT